MKFLLYFSILFSLSACSDLPDKPHFYSSSSLSGEYVACGVNAAGYEKTLLTFYGNNFTISSTIYAETDCEGAFISSSSGSGTFTIGGNSIDYIFSDGTVIYDIYKHSGDRLLVGDRSGGLTGADPQSRPTAYSSSIMFYIIKERSHNHNWNN